MKKIIIYIIFIIHLFVLCSCDPGEYTISLESLSSVTTIELINYENDNQKSFGSWVPNHFDDLLPLDIEKINIIEKLEDNKIQNFKNDFIKTDILDTYYAYNSPKDICIKLTYSNGNFLIIWADYKKNSFAGYIGEYNINGEVISFWGSFSDLRYYENLVNSYFNYEI